MKEELNTRAKFYLQQYAENLSDRIGDIKTYLVQAEYQLKYQNKRKSGAIVDPENREDIDWAISHFQKKVSDWKDRLEKRSFALKEVDEIISQL